MEEKKHPDLSEGSPSEAALGGAESEGVQAGEGEKAEEEGARAESEESTEAAGEPDESAQVEGARDVAEADESAQVESVEAAGEADEPARAEGEDAGESGESAQVESVEAVDEADESARAEGGSGSGAVTPLPASSGATEGLFGFLSRRRWLKLTLLGGGALIGVGGGGLLGLRGCAPSVKGLRLLGAHGYRTLTHLARTQLPRGGAFALGADDFDLARMFDNFLADEPAENVRDLQLALTLIEYGPLLFGGRLKTFSNLSATEQLAHWQSWAVSEKLLQRKVSMAFRKFFSLVFYDQPKVWPHIGYGGPLMGGGKR